MEGKTFQPLAEVLSDEWRVSALDQRGTGTPITRIPTGAKIIWETSTRYSIVFAWDERYCWVIRLGA